MRSAVSGATSGSQAIDNLPPGSVAIGVVVEPLVAWLWAGGLLIGVGGLLALVPGARRKATDPVSSASELVRGASVPAAAEPDGAPARPVGVLTAGRTGPP